MLVIGYWLMLFSDWDKDWKLEEIISYVIIGSIEILILDILLFFLLVLFNGGI